jgi:mono/diheme cytochrome c family protein
LGARLAAAFATLLVVGLVAGVLVFKHETQPEHSIVGRGKLLATSSGCFACHGTSEADPHANFRKTADGSWKPKAIPTFWENGIDTADVIVDWITHGVPEDEAAAHRKLFIQMPAYERFLPASDIDAIATWILSEGVRQSQAAADPASEKVPATEAELQALDPDHLMAVGDRLSRRFGCYQCHGEFGQGGAPNPASLKGYIPGFFGRDFLALTENGDREEIAYWIDHGRGRAIESGLLGAVAKKYLSGQAIAMPAYKDQLSAMEKSTLVEYLSLLQHEGPLSAKKFESLLHLLNEDSIKK